MDQPCKQNLVNITHPLVAIIQIKVDSIFKISQTGKARTTSTDVGNDYNNSRDGTDDGGNDLNIDHLTNSNDGIGVNDCTNNFNDDDDPAFRFTGHSLTTTEDQLSVRCIQMKF